MRIETLAVGPLQSNCHVVTDGESPEAMIVDPGAEAGRIVAVVEALGGEPRWIVDTHPHGDHIAANAALKRRFPEAQLVIHRLDAPALTDPRLNLSYMLGANLVSPAADREVEEGDEIELGRLRFRVLHTPGHTPGGMCLLADTEPPVLFCGDTLFCGGIGRSDFPGGDHAALIDGIRRKLLVLPDATRVLTGHGPETTIGQERRGNPFL